MAQNEGSENTSGQTPNQEVLPRKRKGNRVRTISLAVVFACACACGAAVSKFDEKGKAVKALSEVGGALSELFGPETWDSFCDTFGHNREELEERQAQEWAETR